MHRWTSLHESVRYTDLDQPAPGVWSVVASGYDRPQWYVDAAPFVIRGAIDRLLGGAGRQARPPGTPVLTAGDRAGFWEVTEADHDRHLLVLEAAVRAPGRVVLRTSVEPLGTRRCRLTQRISFTPDGLLGRAYLMADLPSRETVAELAHRRLLRDLKASDGAR